MADLNANIILQGTANALTAEPTAVEQQQNAYTRGQDQELNSQKIESNNYALQEQKQDMSDSQKLTQAAQELQSSGANPTDPDYTDKMSAKMAELGVSGKNAITYERALLSQDSERLDIKSKVQNQVDSALKIDSAQRQVIKDANEDFQAFMGPTLQQYKANKDAKNPDADALAISQTLAFAQDSKDHINSLVSAGTMTKQQGQQALQHLDAEIKGIVQGPKFNDDAADKLYQQSSSFTSQLKTAEEKQALKNEQLQGQNIQSEIADRGKQVVQSMRTNADGSQTPVFGVIDKATGQVKMTDATVAPKNGAPMSARAADISAAMGTKGVGLPPGLTGMGVAGKNAFFEALSRKYPDKSPDEIADEMRAGKLDITGAVKETIVAATRESQISGAMTSIVSPGGIGDQVLQSADKAGIGSSKVLAKGTELLSNIKNSPAYAEFREKHGELVQEMGVVLSKNNPSVHGAEEAARMFPLVSTKPELEAQIKAARDVSQALANGNQSVIDAIKAHKPLNEVLQAMSSSSSSSDSSGSTATPAAGWGKATVVGE